MKRIVLLIAFSISSIILLNYCTSGSSGYIIKGKSVGSLECFKTLSNRKTKIRIMGVTKRDGRGIPNSTLIYNVKETSFNITKYSKNSDYGYSIKKPIFTGGHFLSGSGRQWLFLSNLRDHNGKRVYFERLGSVGFYKDPAGKKSGMVDAYGIRIKGIKRPVILFLSFYGPIDTEIQVPKCFGYSDKDEATHDKTFASRVKSGHKRL